MQEGAIMNIAPSDFGANLFVLVMLLACLVWMLM